MWQRSDVSDQSQQPQRQSSQPQSSQRQSPGKRVDQMKMRPADGRPPSLIKWLGRCVIESMRLPIVAAKFLFAPSQPRRGRRDLLSGRLWKLIPSARPTPLVMRYPEEDTEATHFDEVPRRLPRSIGGINIDPVPATDLKRKSVSRTLPVFRPPGAVEESQFLAGCTRCGDCIAACPHDAIRNAHPRLGPVAGTPVIDPDVAACMMCEDFPCIASCRPGVLSPSIDKVMGTAQVTQHLCLAHHHTTCTVCSERCPVPGAIVVVDGKPTVDENVCTGCGVCRYVCPAPENAILMMPAFSRPSVHCQ